MRASRRTGKLGARLSLQSDHVRGFHSRLVGRRSAPPGASDLYCKRARLNFFSPKSRLNRKRALRVHPCKKGNQGMQLSEKIKTAGATGYILLWLLGIPLPILLLIFLLRGCT